MQQSYFDYIYNGCYDIDSDIVYPNEYLYGFTIFDSFEDYVDYENDLEYEFV